MDPARFEEMRPGCFDIRARVADMDLNGVWASLCFPSLVAGFCGSVFIRSDDPELGLACLRAWNQWHHEVWAGTYPERIIPLQLPWLADVEVAAEEVRANAAAGLQGGELPRVPGPARPPVDLHRPLGPVLRRPARRPARWCACTPGRRRGRRCRRPDPPFELLPTLFPVNALIAAAEWLWSGVAAPVPRSSTVALSEGGIGWVPMLADRVDYVLAHSASGTESRSRGRPSCRPSEVLEAELLVLHHRRPVGRSTCVTVIGVDHIMVESDYPHADSTWPDTQVVMREDASGDLDEAELRMVAAGNAARLFRHPLPPRDDWREL